MRALAPFGAVSLLAVVTALLPPYSDRGGEPLYALGVLAVSAAFQIAATRRAERTWIDPVGAWLFYVVLALLMHATGGSGSGLAALVALPVLWLALFGTRSDIWVAALLTFLTLLVPTVLIGGAAYPTSDWRRAVIWLAICVLVVPVVQEVVKRLGWATQREREASAQVHALLRGAALCSIVVTDVEGTITSFSAGATTLLAHAPEDVVGHVAYTDLHDPAEIERTASELGVEAGFAVFAALARQGAASRIWTYRRRDGATRSVRLALTEVRDDDEVLIGYLGTAIDATTDIATRRALMASDARFRAVMDNLPDTLLMVLDDELGIHLSTGGGAARLGLPDLAGRNLREISKPENVQEIVAMMAEAAQGATARRDLSATSTGAEQELLVRALPQVDAEPAQVVLVTRDVSRDRAQRRAITEARDQAERLFSDAPQGIAVLDAQGCVLRANASLLRLVDREQADVLGAPLAALGGDDDTTLPDHLHEVLSSSSGRSRVDWTILTAGGQEVYVALSSTVLTHEARHRDAAGPGADGGDGLGDGPLESPGVDHTQVLVNVTDVSERRRHEEQLAHLADHDPLTGLANRRRFHTELTQHVEYCRRYGPRGSVLLLDLDHFKEVNDTLGHSAGDQLIVSLAAVIKQSVRASDLVARLGGDEFAILLREGGRRGAETVAAAVVQRVRDLVATLDGTHRNVTASIGVVLVDKDAASPAELLAAADMTMYDAKDAGRDQWAILDRDLFDQPRSGARLAWASRLEAALDHDDFVLHLQPIWDLEQQRVTGAEALLRLCDGPDLVYPDRFLYVAERNDLIKRIDGWVLDQAMGLLAELQAIDPTFSLEVNVSGRSIGSPQLEAALVGGLARHGVDPAGLVLEITETAAVADVATARAFAERVAALGCRFALDDFGAGFGSFYYLKHLIFDFVKIDGEFVSSCHVSPTDRAIVHSIVDIAHDLGKQTIAEFCSEQAILDVVREEGVDLAQGYHVGRPVPMQDFLAAYLPSGVR